jgi:hypothetical protein
MFKEKYGMRKIELKKGQQPNEFMAVCVQQLMDDDNSMNDLDAMAMCRDMLSKEEQRLATDHTIGGQESEMESSLSGGLFQIMSP